MNFEFIAAFGSVLLGILAPLPYIRATFWGKTKPHIFSWIIWTLAVGIAFYGQIIGGGGVGSAALGITVVMNLIIVGAAFIKSKDYINKYDVLVFTLVLLAMIPWVLADDPVTSILLLALIDFGGFLPTIRKSFNNPETESLSLYIASAAKHLLSLYALSAYNPLTLTFPLMLIVLNSLMALILVVRKRQLRTA